MKKKKSKKKIIIGAAAVLVVAGGVTVAGQRNSTENQIPQVQVVTLREAMFPRLLTCQIFKRNKR